MKEVIDFIYDRVDGNITGTLTKAAYPGDGDMLNWVSSNGSYTRKLTIKDGIVQIVHHQYLTNKTFDVLTVSLSDPNAIEKAVQAFMDMAITI